MSQALLSQYCTSMLPVFGKPLAVLDHGQGCRVWDDEGNEYLDFLSGIAVNSLGYAHPRWLSAVTHQAAKLAHTCNYFATEPQIELASTILEIAKVPEGSRVYFANSGAEANEAALKLARLHARRKQVRGGDDRKHDRVGNTDYDSCTPRNDEPGNDEPHIVAMVHGFHGRTLGALSVTHKPSIREPFEPLVPHVTFVEPNDKESLRQVFSSRVDAVILELIQGEAGVLPIDPSYVHMVRQYCTQHDALMILDEVQTGIGRTGYWFAYQSEQFDGLVPDVITFAKGVASGFPFGGIIAVGKNVASLFTPSIHGSTFVGNPLGSAAALATLNTIEQEHLLDNVRARSAELIDGLTTCHPLVTSVRGSGLMLGVCLSRPCAHNVANWALSHGLIINAVRSDVIRLVPPLIITSEDIAQALAILAQVPFDIANDEL